MATGLALLPRMLETMHEALMSACMGLDITLEYGTNAAKFYCSSIACLRALACSAIQVLVQSCRWKLSLECFKKSMPHLSWHVFHL